MDILTDAYGYSPSAPNALRLGERVPDFVAPRAGGGHVALATLRAKGPVVVIFYRGHW
jgi:peroxiredoxin